MLRDRRVHPQQHLLLTKLLITSKHCLRHLRIVPPTLAHRRHIFGAQAEVVQQPTTHRLGKLRVVHEQAAVMRADAVKSRAAYIRQRTRGTRDPAWSRNSLTDFFGNANAATAAFRCGHRSINGVSIKSAALPNGTMSSILPLRDRSATELHRPS